MSLAAATARARARPRRIQPTAPALAELDRNLIGRLEDEHGGDWSGYCDLLGDLHPEG